TYFVTSADSGTLVVTTILANGHPNPPMQQRLIWGIGQGFVAGALLLGGGLSALQTASISAALPFSIVLLLMILGLVKSLRAESVGPQFDQPALETTN
ncbi:MAG: choline/glycine/proline betaine transport protein, partial [Arenicella sp.]